jgi:hypothetical protein
VAKVVNGEKEEARSMAKESLNFNEQRALVTVAGLCVLVWSAGIFLVGSTDQVGERASAIEALFSGFGLIGVLTAVYLQKKELSYQRRELRLTRKELRLTREEVKKTAEAQQKSERALSVQAKSMMLTARLSAVSAILNDCNERHAYWMRTTDEVKTRTAELKREKYRMMLEVLTSESLFLNSLAIFGQHSPIVPFQSMVSRMKGRVASEAEAIRLNHYDDAQFAILLDSIMQETESVLEVARDLPAEIRELLGDLVHQSVASRSQAKPGIKTSIESHDSNCKNLLKILENLLSTSFNNKYDLDKFRIRDLGP